VPGALKLKPPLGVVLVLFPPKLNDGVGLASEAAPPKLKAGAGALAAPNVAVVVPPNVGAGLLAPNVLGVEDEKEKPLLVGAAPNAGVVVAVPPKLNPDVEVAGAPKVAAGAGVVPPKLKLGAAAGAVAAPNDGAGVEPNDGAGVEPKEGVVVAPKAGVVPNVVDPPKDDMVEVAGCAPNEKAGVVEAAAGNEKPPVSDAPKCLGLREEASIPSTSALLSA